MYLLSDLFNSINNFAVKDVAVEDNELSRMKNAATSKINDLDEKIDNLNNEYRRLSEEEKRLKVFQNEKLRERDQLRLDNINFRNENQQLEETKNNNLRDIENNIKINYDYDNLINNLKNCKERLNKIGDITNKSYKIAELCSIANSVVGSLTDIISANTHFECEKKIPRTISYSIL